MKLDSIAHEDYEKQEHVSDVMAMVERIIFRERNAFYEAGYAEGYAERDKEMEDACSRHCEACEDKCLPWKKGCESGLLQGEQIGYDKGRNEYRKANCGNCTHGVQITYCKRWKNAFTAGEEACAEWEEVDD